MDGLVLFVFFLLLYLIVRYDSQFQFYHFDVWRLSWLAYADAIFWLTVPFWLPCSSFSSGIIVPNRAESLLSDDPDPEDLIDLAGNGSFVEAIGKRINNTTAESSFAVGIFGPWGSGKTHFLMSLRNYLRTDVSGAAVNQVFYFNPWKSGNVETIVDDFFVVLSNAMKPFNRSIAQGIKRYAKKLFGPGKDFASRVADTIVDEFMPDSSLEDKFESIRRGIIATGRRFIFLIDDIDRMTGIEIMQVIKIIRTTANFGNVFFIVTLDLPYTLEALKNTKLYSREDDYLKKIFQLTVTLPPIRTETLAGGLLQLLLPNQPDNAPDQETITYEEELKMVVNSLRHNDLSYLVFGSSRRTSHLESMLDNFRDLKRFTNAFTISQQLTKGEVDLGDLFLLELIKAKSVYTHENLANESLLKQEGDDRHFELDEEAWEAFADRKMVQPEALDKLKKAIERLFSYDPKKSQRQISRRVNFYLYFNYQLFGLISLRDFSAAIKKPWKEMNAEFMAWWVDGRQRDLEDILDGYKEYADLDEFRRFSKVFIQNANEHNFDIRAKTLLFNVSSSNFQAFFKTDAAYSAFVLEIINDEELPLLYRARIAKDILTPTTEQMTPMKVNYEDITVIIEQLFKSYLKDAHGFDGSIHEFLLLNGAADDSHHYRIRPTAADLLKEYLRADPVNFDEFLKVLIRSYMIPNDGSFTFEPFTEQIFGTWEEFEHDLLRHIPISQEVKNIIQYIKKYRDYKSGNTAFFVADLGDRGPILDHLRKTGQYELNNPPSPRGFSRPPLSELF